jgi:hypothetical protein
MVEVDRADGRRVPAAAGPAAPPYLLSFWGWVISILECGFWEMFWKLWVIRLLYDTPGQVWNGGNWKSGGCGRMEVELCEIPMHVGKLWVIRLLYDTPGQV